MSFVFKQDSSFIFNCSVAKIDIYKSRDKHKHDEKCTNEHLDLVFLLKKESWHSNSNIIAARTIRVSILLEIFISSFVSKNLQVIWFRFSVVNDLQNKLL